MNGIDVGISDEVVSGSCNESNMDRARMAMVELLVLRTDALLNGVVGREKGGGRI
jgi:hypothetical protein